MKPQNDCKDLIRAWDTNGRQGNPIYLAFRWQPNSYHRALDDLAFITERTTKPVGGERRRKEKKGVGRENYKLTLKNGKAIAICSEHIHRDTNTNHSGLTKNEIEK